jgi:hypothetical protein
MVVEEWRRRKRDEKMQVGRRMKLKNRKTQEEGD